MKITINDGGNLVIDGVGRICPVLSASSLCGDWCALFRGPIYDGYSDSQIAVNHVSVELCRRVWVCDAKDFTDERVTE